MVWIEGGIVKIAVAIDGAVTDKSVTTRHGHSHLDRFEVVEWIDATVAIVLLGGDVPLRLICRREQWCRC